NSTESLAAPCLFFFLKKGILLLAIIKMKANNKRNMTVLFLTDAKLVIICIKSAYSQEFMRFFN
ncbi:MAG TPA: hypothetical protein PLF38_04780, partial [Xylanibacter oryzae]|nr:hypothetical protein [Xylanibacter oryzae]